MGIQKDLDLDVPAIGKRLRHLCSLHCWQMVYDDGEGYQIHCLPSHTKLRDLTHIAIGLPQIQAFLGQIAWAKTWKVTR